MPVEETRAYAPLLRAIHWATAVLFIAAMLIGLYCGLQPPGTSPRRELLEVHKSAGMTLLFLSVLRLAVRLATKAPPEPESFGWLVRLAARLNHWALYAILFAMPLTGYAFSSAGGYSLKYFWTFSWPRLVADNPAIAHAGELSHDTLAWLVYAVVALHIAATVWHAVVMRDGTLARMWPRAGSRKRSAG
ncbi:cytochrome b [Bradyrhizobium sp. BR 10289]|uniref:cytochrome b n=1 Tax=Bradyrhizobium sp. BR 10289 TaxID=2749993 RepID=UPI001C64BF8C|nr:cytochrome b [Bradyrhizobium sp. BR 10289]MBW7968728.1 cytochrome b [Bradyrhizobium sp. BR 10289]